jgi:GTP cyclohydrolase IA
MTLGQEVHRHLEKLGIETPAAFRGDAMQGQHKMVEAVQTIMRLLGMHLEDDSLKRTPHRVAKMYAQEIFYGLDYDNFPECTTILNKMSYDELLTQRCSVVSLCEHHLIPFQGIAFVGYIPRTKVIGLSKLNRIVDFFARRPQVQERLTVQISATLQYVLDTEDVAVIMRCEHLCVKLRGIKDQLSHTTTSKMSGKFFTQPSLRQEFLLLSNNHS